MRIICFALLLVFAFGSSTRAQDKTTGAGKKVQFIFHSVHGAPDLIEMCASSGSHRHAMSKVLPLIDEFKFYEMQLAPYPNSDNLFLVQGNFFNNLSKAGCFATISQVYQKPVSVEVGVLRTKQNCLTSPKDLNLLSRQTVGVGLRLYQNGSRPYGFYVDTSMGQCGLRHLDVAYRVSLWIRRVSSDLPQELRADTKFHALPYEPVLFSDIEPYPSVSIENHKSYLIRLHSHLRQAGLPPLDTYILDIDHAKIDDLEKFATEIRELYELCRVLHVKLGVIIVGDESISITTDNDAAYFRGATRRLVRLKQSGVLNLVDVIVVQSWVQNSKGPNDRFGLTIRPTNLPDTEPNTHTNFFIHVKKCHADTVDCASYP